MVGLGEMVSWLSFHLQDYNQLYHCCMRPRIFLTESHVEGFPYFSLHKTYGFLHAFLGWNGQFQQIHNLFPSLSFQLSQNTEQLHELSFWHDGQLLFSSCSSWSLHWCNVSSSWPDWQIPSHNVYKDWSWCFPTTKYDFPSQALYDSVIYWSLLSSGIMYSPLRLELKNLDLFH